MSAEVAVRLSDYQPPLWLVDALELRFELFSAETLVHAQLSIQRSADQQLEPLCWPAVAMEIQELLGIDMANVEAEKARPLSDDLPVSVGPHTSDIA